MLCSAWVVYSCYCHWSNYRITGKSTLIGSMAYVISSCDIFVYFDISYPVTWERAYQKAYYLKSSLVPRALPRQRRRLRITFSTSFLVNTLERKSSLTFLGGMYMLVMYSDTAYSETARRLPLRVTLHFTQHFDRWLVGTCILPRSFETMMGETDPIRKLKGTSVTRVTRLNYVNYPGKQLSCWLAGWLLMTRDSPAGNLRCPKYHKLNIRHPK